MSVRVAGVVAAAVVLLVTAAGAEPREPAPRAHVVVQGDTLGAIATRYNVTVSALVTANRLPSERARLRIGQRLTARVGEETIERASSVPNMKPD